MIAALFWRGSTKWGALAATVWTISAVFAVAIFQESVPAPAPGPPTVVATLGGFELLARTYGGTTVFGFMPVVPMVIVSTLLMFIVSLLTPKPKNNFLTQRSLYLLVLSGRGGGEDDDADYWLKLVESFGSESPVVVVLNKIKEHPFDVNRRALQQKYPAIREFIKTDCKDSTGIAELHKAIERETDRLEHLRDAFPASWFTIKDKLAGMSKLKGKKKNYLSFEEYRKVCKEQGEEGREAQEALAGYLHTLGIALNYRDDPRLQDTHVLNPHWVTNGIYKILNAEKLERQKGEIRVGRPRRDSGRGGVPARDAPVRVRFDEEVRPVFQLPGRRQSLSDPGVAGQAAAGGGRGVSARGVFEFRVSLHGAAGGAAAAVHRADARAERGAAALADGRDSGFRGLPALVKGDVQDKKVFINVSGPATSRRRLLAVIRSDFERIHRDIRNLQPQEIVPVPGHPKLLVPYRKLQVMEERGVKQFAEVAGDDVVDLNVRELLNGVDLEGMRRREGRMERELRREAARLFISYSHKDDKLREELQTHIKLLERLGVVDAWDDRRIGEGDEWKERIDDNLERADIILLLVSANFIASDYCYEKEMGRAADVLRLPAHVEAEPRHRGEILPRESLSAPTRPRPSWKRFRRTRRRWRRARATSWRRGSRRSFSAGGG